MNPTMVAVGLGWTDEAACVDLPQLPWIGPRRGQPLNQADMDQMTETCQQCPVLDQCRRYVDQADVTAGFWAGSWQHVDTFGYAGGRVA